MANKKYIHSVSMNIEIKSGNENPTGPELLKAYQDRIKEIESLRGEELENCFEVFASDEEE